MTDDGSIDLTAIAAELPSWTVSSETLSRSVSAPTFLTAIAWVVAIADEAEARDHHPDVDIRWRTLHFTLSTHSAGHVTAKDVDLAHAIDRIVGT